MFMYEYDLCAGIASPGQVQDQKLCLDPFTLQKNPILFYLSHANVWELSEGPDSCVKDFLYTVAP